MFFLHSLFIYFKMSILFTFFCLVIILLLDVLETKVTLGGRVIRSRSPSLLFTCNSMGLLFSVYATLCLSDSLFTLHFWERNLAYK